MTEWKIYKIGDLCKISSSKRIFAKEYKDSGIPFYRGKEIIEKQKGNKISTELYISQERYDEIRAKHGVPQKGDMLLTSVGTLGIPYIVQDEVFYFKDGNLTWFYDFEDLDSRYLYYWFLSPIGKMNIDSKAIGSTQKALTIETLSKFEISLPGLEEQRRIAGILGAIDDKIECNRRINANLESQAQALYKQWFVDFEFPNEEGKPYKSSGSKMIDSELGLIPEGWSVGKLEDVGTIVGGGTPSKAKQEYYTSNGIAWITPKDLSITHAKFTAKGEVDITDIGYANSSAKMMPRGSILFSSRAPIGYISIAKNDICTNQGFKSVVPNNGCTTFVYYFLLSNTENIESKATGSTFKEASGALMKSLELVIPSDDILEKFEKIMSPIFESQEKFEAENETLATLRDTLLPKLMNGEIKL